MPYEEKELVGKIDAPGGLEVTAMMTTKQLDWFEVVYRECPECDTYLASLYDLSERLITDRATFDRDSVWKILLATGRMV